VRIPRTLVVTNEFLPRVGGIQRFVHSLVGELPPERVTVLAPSWDGDDEFDRSQAYRVVRQDRNFLWPTPGLGRRVEQLAGESGAEVVLFGAPMPLAALGPRLAERGLPYLSLAHGFDLWLSLAPGAHAALRRATSRASAVLVCSRYVGRIVRTAVPPAVPVSVLSPGADPERFRPDVGARALRDALGLGNRPLVVCVSRLVRRKGQDVLIRAMPQIRARAPDATLLIVGDGPDRRRLEGLAREAPGASVMLVGEVAEQELAAHYAAADVFAMPCRDRLGGLEVEGWGAVFVEAAACGRPVVAGRSGGAPESLVDGRTGIVVDGRDPTGVGEAVGGLLADPDRASRMGSEGRARVERELSWAKVAERLAGWLRRASEHA
jgi:phosphatidyl-myo-inositol dimannoside synthase